jgi:hypothetical protein
MEKKLFIRLQYIVNIVPNGSKYFSNYRFKERGQESSGSCGCFVLSDDRLTAQEPRLMEWGILKEKFRAAAAERSDEIEGVEVNGEVPND